MNQLGAEERRQNDDKMTLFRGRGKATPTENYRGKEYEEHS